MAALGSQEPYFSKHAGGGQGTWGGHGGTWGRERCSLGYSVMMMMEGLQGGCGDA